MTVNRTPKFDKDKYILLDAFSVLTDCDFRIAATGSPILSVGAYMTVFFKSEPEKLQDGTIIVKMRIYDDNYSGLFFPWGEGFFCRLISTGTLQKLVANSVLGEEYLGMMKEIDYGLNKTYDLQKIATEKSDFKRQAKFNKYWRFVQKIKVYTHIARRCLTHIPNKNIEPISITAALHKFLQTIQPLAISGQIKIKAQLCEDELLSPVLLDDMLVILAIITRYIANSLAANTIVTLTSGVEKDCNYVNFGYYPDHERQGTDSESLSHICKMFTAFLKIDCQIDAWGEVDSEAFKNQGKRSEINNKKYVILRFPIADISEAAMFHQENARYNVSFDVFEDIFYAFDDAD